MDNNSDYIRQTMEMDQSNYIGGQTLEENVDGQQDEEHHTLHAMTTVARMTSGDQLLISACGRTCSIDMHYARSLVDLQGELQRKLQMDGQIFHICDINGALLSTDMQVTDAIGQGLTPLCATLPDKSLHHLENRREELAQMQWKLIRDQMSNTTNQIAQLTRQCNEVQFSCQALTRETTHTLEQMRMEAQQAKDKERATTKAELLPLHEAVNGAILLINGERSKRELSVQGFEKHIHGVCDMLDGERASRRQDLAMHMAVMQEIKASLETERNARFDVEQLVAELRESNNKFTEDMKARIGNDEETVAKVVSDLNTLISDNSTRFMELEDRVSVAENSMSEITAWTTSSLDKMTERHERVSGAAETNRLTLLKHEGSIANCMERIQDVDSLVRQYGVEVREDMSREKQVRDDQVRRTSQVFTNESLKQVTELEKRLTIRLERESAEREKNFQSMIDEVTRVCEDRKLFRDQTITKTIAAPGGQSALASPTRLPMPGDNRDRTQSSPGRIPGQEEQYSSNYLGNASARTSYQPPSEATYQPEPAQEKVQPMLGSQSITRTAPLSGSVGMGSRPTSPTPTQMAYSLSGQKMALAPNPAQQLIGSVTLPVGTVQAPRSPSQGSGSRGGSMRAGVAVSPLSPRNFGPAPLNANYQGYMQAGVVQARSLA